MYGKYPTTERGWYRPYLEHSMAWIEHYSEPHDHVLDAGGGASNLAASLLARGYGCLTVVDLSRVALDEAASTVPSGNVSWVQGDVRDPTLALMPVDLWHDRAVFHFMTTPSDRSSYLACVRRTLKPGGILIVGAFNPDAPPKCSGLPVQRYTPQALANAFGTEFSMMDHATVAHTTPGGVEQPYSYVALRRSA